MKKRSNWLKKSIAMITLVATVIETGFSSVATYAAVLNTDDGIESSIESADDVLTEGSSSQDDVKIEVISGEEEQGAADDLDVSEEDSLDDKGDQNGDDIDAPDDNSEADSEEEVSKTEPSIDVSDSGISGLGYDEVSVYIDTDNLSKNDRFSVKFTGSDSASYNPVLNEELDKTNGGRYDFTNLNGNEFKIRATATDNVILSYKYNEDGNPVITAASKSADKVLTTKVLTAVDDTRISAVAGEGFDSITISFDTDDLSAKDVFKLYVESDASATVDGRDATKGIGGLDKNSGSARIEGLDGESFVAYVVSDSTGKLETVAEVTDAEAGTAVIDINNVATKRVYEYEDSKVYVRATLEKADAVPDDAYFDVTPLTEEEAEKYLEVLNSNKAEEAEEYTRDNTLLYNIGFYTDESKNEEIEPEDGSVSLSVEFRNDQLKEDLGAETREDIEVTHFIEEGAAIETEKLNVQESSNVSTIDVTTETFSKFAFTVQNNTGKVDVDENSIGNETSKGLLGDAWLYGITADTWYFNGEAETSFALNKLTGKNGAALNGGQTGVNSSKAEGSNFQYSMVGDVNGKTRIKGYRAQVVMPHEQWNRLTHESGSGYIRYVDQSANKIKTQVDGMISAVQTKSDSLAALDSAVNYNGLPANPSGNHIYMDITDAPDGTIYINLDKYTGLKNAFKNNGQVHIIKNKGQKIVFNTKDTQVRIDKFDVKQGNDEPLQSTAIADMSSAKNPIVEDLIFNMPNATNLHIQEAAGIFLAPKASVTVGGVGGGWLVCNNVATDCEWHFVNGNLPEPKDNEAEYDFVIGKEFDGPWPSEGFTFRIESYPGDSNNTGVTVDPKVMPANREITVYSTDPDGKKSFGKITFSAKDIYDKGRDVSAYWTAYSGYNRSVHCMCYMYKIYEVIPNPKNPSVIYDEKPWYLKLWVNAEKVNAGNGDEYIVTIEPKTARSVKDGTICEPGDTQPIVFTNTYVPVDVPVKLEGEKKVNGKTAGIPSGKFTFNLYEYDRNDQWKTPAKYSVQNVGNHFEFPEMTLKFSQATGYNTGKTYAEDPSATEAYFYFKIEEDSNCAPYAFDGTVYIAKITVTRTGTGFTKQIQYYRFADPQKVSCKNYPQKNYANEVDGVTIEPLSFNNTYAAEGKTKFYGHKKLENRKFKDGDYFEFTLTPKKVKDKDFDDHNAPQTIKIYPKPENNYDYDFEYDWLTYTLADAGKTYTYTLAEKAGNDANIEYSSEKYDVEVTVTDNGNNTLTAAHGKATKRCRACFKNIYGAKGEVQFKATKRYKTGSALAATKKFSFVLKDVTDPTKPVTLDTQEVIGEDTATFKKIDYADINKAGTYRYTINEVLPEGATAENNYTVDGIIYDHRTYNITVVVSDDTNGKLETDISGAYDTGEETEDVKNPIFINDYRVNEVSEPFGGNKELHGKKLERGEFTFILSAKDDTTQNAVDKNIVILSKESVKNSDSKSEIRVKNGEPESKIQDPKEFRFGDITFKAAGNYSFLITEEQGSEEGIQYSTAQYTVNIEIKDDGKGNLYVASRDVLNKDIKFINTKTGDGEVKLYAKKELKGRKLEKNQFTFELKDAEGNVIETKSNDENGNVAFTPIKYYNNTDILKLDNPGDTATFDYTINEVIPDPIPKGYVYDDEVKEIHVTVTLKEDGSLDAQASDATFVKPAVFNNEYTAKGTLELDGTKEITGRPFDETKDAGKFFAELYDKDGNLIGSDEIEKDTGKWGITGGAFEFEPIVFTQDDLMTSDGNYVTKIEREYTVIETGEEDGIKMDQTVYTVLVTVEDFGTGELNVTKQYLVGGTEVSGLNFVNIQADGSAVIQARKRLIGAELKEGTFEFELRDDSDPAKIKTATETNKDGGLVVFSGENVEWLKYDIDDVASSPFTYTLSEKFTDKEGYILDRSVYTVRVWLDLCLDENGTPNGSMETHVKYYKSSEFNRETGELKVLSESEWINKEVPEASVEFVNEYKSTGSVQIHANKILTGGVLQRDKFEFILYDELGNIVGTASNGNDPKNPDDLNTALFPEIIYTQDDLDATKSHLYDDDKNTYIKNYTVMERIPYEAEIQNDGTYKYEGYTYDTGVYSVVVTLRDNGDGTIKTDWYTSRTGETHDVPTTWEVIKDTVKSWFGYGELKNAEFINKYDAAGVLELSAKKILTGKDLGKNDFSFELSGTLESGETFTDIELNDADGNVKFNKILYTTTGSYTYKIRELVPDGAQEVNGVFVYNGVKYDGTVYTVNVKVEDPGAGMLTVTAEIEGRSAVTSAEVVDSEGKKISLCKPAPVDFTNTYDCEPVSITLGGDKTLVGRDLKDENEFSFTIKSAEKNPKKFEQTVTVNKDINGNYGTFEFDKITFEFDDMLENGKYLGSKTFAYVISEDIPSGATKLSDGRYVYNDVTYDTKTYDVVITVTNSNGKLAAKVTRNDTELADPSKAASFRNYYDTENSLILEVEKLVLGTNNNDTAFDFELTGTDIDGKLTTTAYNGLTANFAPIKYTLEGIKNTDGTYAKTYNYTVKEAFGNVKGYDYSDEVYTVTVNVTSDGKSGKIDISEPVIKKNDAAYDKFTMVFTNTYTAKGEIDIPGFKEMVGKDLTEGDFEFALSQNTGKLDKNGNVEYKGIATTTNDADGNFSFKLSYTQADIGVYNYTVNEVIPDNASEGKIDYDKSIYNVTVTVTDNKDGTLKVTRDIRKGTSSFEKCVFKNKEIKPNQVEFEAIKTLSGKALKDDMFTFSMTGDDGYYEEVTNKGEHVSFKTMTYSYKDIGKTFTYTIEEHGKSGDGITYDATKYKRIVKVLGFDEDNKIKLDVKTLANGKVADEIKFENKYESTASVQFGGHKFLEGFDNEAIPLGKYTFELLDENNNTVHINDKGEIVAEGGKEQKVTIIPKNAKDPTDYTFDEIKFDQDDLNDYATDERLIRFKVKEVMPVASEKAPNVKYAENEYNITVRLYYDVNGLLKAETSTKEGVTVKDLDFTNKYAADGEIIIDGVKTITGKDIENAAYTFTLTGEGQDQEVTREAVNAGNVFTFGKISYKAADIGEHTYTVKETASKDGSAIDTKVYTVKVYVNEGEGGKLDVSKRVFTVDENGGLVEVSTTPQIVFNNKFEASGKVDIEGLKIMHNRPLKAGDFTFVLKDMLTGEVKDTVSSSAAPLNNKTDLEARAAFKFKPLEFTQSDLKSADGTSYLSETRKYYSVEEVNSKKGGVKYSDNVYIIEVTVKSNGTKDLEVSKKVSLKNKSNEYSEEKTSLLDSLKLLFGRDDAEYNTKIIFDNTYDSECVIDPPILRKQIMGKKIERGDFTFEITGPGLRSMGEEKTGYKRTVKNGYAADGSIYGADGKEIPVSEIYAGDIKYKYIDLIDDESFTLEEGAKERTFVYTAVEVPGSDKGTDYSKQEFQLTVKVVDDGEGHLYTIPEIKDMKWVPLTDYRLSDEQMSDTFLNIFNQEGSIDLAGIKKLEGRKLTKDDKFEFTLTDDANPANTVTVQNSVDKDGIPSLIEFNAKDVSFLNYRYGAYEKNPDRKEGDPVEFYKVDDTGIHTYTIVEKSIDNNNGIKYDTAAFKVYVDVEPAVDEKGNYIYDSKGHGKLDAKVTNVEKIYSDNNKVKFEFAGGKYFEFTNEFKAAGKLDINGVKYLKDQAGKTVNEDLTGKFGFALYQYDDAARTKGKSLVDIKNTDKDGKFTLELPEYDQEVLKNENGEYAETKTQYYRIIETKPSDGEWTENNTIFESKGIIYDSTEYDVDVTITFDGTKNLKLEKSIKKAATGEAVTDVSFTNIKRDYVTIEGTKTWVDDVKDASSRPDVVLNLYSSAVEGGKKVINTYTIKAPGKTYEFTADSAGNLLPAYDANGKAITYRVEEVAIDGYLTEQKGYDFYNTRGHITIRKIDADTGVALEGATLAILDGKSEIEKWTTEASAHVVKAALKPGKKYTLHEISAPAGYDIAEDMTFTVPADGSDITVTMKDKPIIGTVKLTKRDSATRAALAGAEFALYNDAGTRIYATGSAGSYKATSATSNGVFAVNSSGELTISNLPYGAYYFVETKAPDGYTLSSEKLGFTIAKSDTTVEVSFLNKESVGAVRLRKVSEDGSRSLAGAVFELYAATPRSIGQAVSSTIFRDAYYRYGSYTTNSSGEIYVDNLPWDDYYFVEVQAPDGYQISKDLDGNPLVYTFTVSESTAGTTIELGDIVNPREPEGAVLGERRSPESGVLGVRSAPKKGVLGTRVGPATGDASAIALWIAVMIACIGTIVWLLIDRRKKRVHQ